MLGGLGEVLGWGCGCWKVVGVESGVGKCVGFDLVGLVWFGHVGLLIII